MNAILFMYVFPFILDCWHDSKPRREMSDQEIDSLEDEACRDDGDGEIDYAKSIAVSRDTDTIQECTEEELEELRELGETELFRDKIKKKK